MNNFMYNTPTKVFFGKDAADNISGFIKGFGARRVLIIYGGESAKRSGLIDKITSQLNSNGIAYLSLGGVEPNPKVGLVREAAALCKKGSIDLILAVGGGSVIDTAKCAAFAAKCDADPWDIVTGKAAVTERVPVAAVLTISAAGSEMSNSEVITNPDVHKKVGLTHELSRPVAAFMDPTLTFTVSKYQTGCGIVDIMMHTLERYFTQGETGTELTDRIAESLLLSVKEAGEKAIKDPEDYDARATLMWASSLSHNGLTSCGKNFSGLVVHKFEHGLSGVFDRVSHGAGLSVLYPAWARYIYKHDIPRFSRIATAVWGVEKGKSPEKTALLGIDAMRDYFASIGMPVTLSELQVYPENFEAIADNITACGTTTVNSYVPLGKNEIMDIFNIAK